MYDALAGIPGSAYSSKRPLTKDASHSDVGQHVWNAMAPDVPAIADAGATGGVLPKHQPFIACAGDAVVSLAMWAAAERADRCAQDVSLP